MSNLTLIALFFPLLCMSQQAKSPSLFFELGGSGGLASINAEKEFYQKNKLSLTGRIGFSLAPIDKNNGVGLVFPIMIHGLLGKEQHKLELGIGQGITLTTKGNFFMLTTPSVAYRFRPNNSPWFYRFAYTPLVSYLIDFQYQNWAGISIGYTFKTSEK